MRYSLRWLFVATLFIAISVVALLNANFYWTSGARSLLLFFVSFALVGTVLCRGKSRAFWTGFAIFSLFRFVVSGLAFSTLFTPLLMDEAIGWLYSGVARQHTEQQMDYLVNVLVPVVTSKPEYESFVSIARCITIVLIGMLGGCIATWLYSRRDPFAPTPTE